MLTSISYMDSTCRHCNKSGMEISTFCLLHFSASREGDGAESENVYTAIFCFSARAHGHHVPTKNERTHTCKTIDHPTSHNIFKRTRIAMACIQMCTEDSVSEPKLMHIRWIAVHRKHTHTHTSDNNARISQNSCFIFVDSLYIFRSRITTIIIMMDENSIIAYHSRKFIPFGGIRTGFRVRGVYPLACSICRTAQTTLQ